MKNKSADGKRTVRTLSPTEHKAHFNMLNLCYEPWGGEEEWLRRYLHFPDFDVSKNVIVVEENGEWAGGGTAWFRQASLANSATIQVYEAGDLYVHPKFQGKGIYSTAMRSLNELARKRGAALGFAFPTIYGLAVKALPKYGFVKILNPETRLFVLRPEKFTDYLVSHMKFAIVSRKLEDLTVKLILSFASNGKKSVTRLFNVKKGQLVPLNALDANSKRSDLTVRADIKTFVRIIGFFYRGKMALLANGLVAMLRGRLRLGFSVKFLRKMLGL